MLPGRKLGRFETRAAQPSRRASSAGHFATIRAKRRMEETVTQAQPERQLAKVRTQAIVRRWQAVAIVTHQMRSQQRLRLLIRKNK